MKTVEIDIALGLIDTALEKQSLNDLQELIFVGSWHRKTYVEIAEQHGYDNDYIRETGSQLWHLLSEAISERVTKRNLHSVLGRLHRQQGSQQKSLTSSASYPQDSISQDWGDAPEQVSFLGREKELSTLTAWITQDDCRMVGVFGMGGTGKTVLLSYQIKQIQSDYEYLIWRSVRNAPLLKELLADLIQLLSGNQETEQSLPRDSGDRITLLLRYFKQHRCLLVLDNVESLLKSGTSCGRYRSGYENYGLLFKQVGEQSHQSCLLVTSREKPIEFSQLEGKECPVRSLNLMGLQPEIGRRLIQQKGEFSATENAWQRLTELYSGNPLALQIVAAAIQDLFHGDIERFLENFVIVFDDIDFLLDEQFSRLSSLEQKIMYWLAIEREPIDIATLEEDILQSMPRRKLFEALKSLVRRSLVYQTSYGFTQQPVVMEYLIERLQQKVTQEIIDSSPNGLIDFALVKSQNKEYIRISQKRALLEPIQQELLGHFKDKTGLEKKLKHLIELLREEFSELSGYAAGNILSLMQSLEIEVRNFNFSGLPIRQIDFQNTVLQSVNLEGAWLNDSVFSCNFNYWTSVAISPDGKTLASGNMQGNIVLWNFPEMNEHQLLNGHSHWARKLIFSRDSQRLVSAAHDQTVKVWNLQTNEPIATLEKHIGLISVVLSPDEKTIISAGHDGQIKFWDIATWKCVQTLQSWDTSRRNPEQQMITGLGISPNGTTLISGSSMGYLKMHNLLTGQSTPLKSEHLGVVWSVIFEPHTNCFFTSIGTIIKQWDCHTGDCLRTLQGHSSQVVELSCSPDGQYLASGSYDHTVRLWEVESGQCIHVLEGHDSDIWGLTFTTAGRQLVSVSLDNSIRLWEVETGHLLKTVRGNNTTLWDVTFTPDGKQLITGGEDQMLRLWDVDGQTCLKNWQAHDNAVTQVALHSDGQILASSSGDRLVKLWDMASGQCQQVLQGQENWLWSIDFSPNGKWIAGSGRSSDIHIWDVETGHCIKHLVNAHPLFIWEVAFSSDSRLLASGSYDHTIKLWDTDTWQCVSTLVGHKDFIDAVCFSPTGQWLASSGHDRSVKIWDFERGNCVQTLEGHQDVIWSIAFNPDGKLLASASFDHTVRVWNVKTGDCLHTLKGHQGFVHSVCFHPFQNLLASSDRDGTVRLWNLDSGECSAVLEVPKLYEGLNITGVSGITPTQRQMLLALGAVEKAQSKW